MFLKLERYSIYIALAAAWIALCGSLYFSEVAGFIPCRYCWFQRILMYPLALILAVGILRHDRGVVAYALPLSVSGIVLSTYHYMLQKTTLFGVSSCQEGVPCSTMWINWLGFITIPFLAMSAFLVITVMLLAGMQSFETVLDDEGRPPWLAVGSLIGVVIALFLAMAQLNSAKAASTSPALVIDLTPIAVGELNLATIDGAQLYADNCAVCHGDQGQGVAVVGIPLQGSRYVLENEDASLAALIITGRSVDDPANHSGRMMPPYGGKPALTDDELLAIIRHIRSFNATGS